MKLLFENWRKHLKEEVIDAELRFLQKIASDNGEVLQYKEENGKHIMTLWTTNVIVGEYKGEELLKLWTDIIKAGDEKMIPTFFNRTMEGEYLTRDGAMEWAKDTIEVLQDINREEEPDSEPRGEVVSLHESWRRYLKEFLVQT